MIRSGSLLWILALCAGVAFAEVSNAEMTVQFVARGLRGYEAAAPALGYTSFMWVRDEKHDPSPGHVFMIVTVPTRSGPKEEIFGFYPHVDTGGAILKGPGMLRSEFRCGDDDDCNPKKNNLLKRMSESEESVEIPITPDQRLALMETISAWNGKEYSLSNQNCTHFISDAVVKLGFPPLPRGTSRLPVEMIKDLNKHVAAEQGRRTEAARRAEEVRNAAAKRAREQAARETARAEAERQAVEARVAKDKEATRKRAINDRLRQPPATLPPAASSPVPSDWDQCECPNEHAIWGAKGMWYQNRFHHPHGPRCS